MNRDVYRYEFDDKTPLSDVRGTIHMAIFSAEGLHGRAQVRLDAGYHLDERRRVCVVDAATPVGQDVARIFTGLLTREFGEDAFTVERVDGPPAARRTKPCDERRARRRA